MVPGPGESSKWAVEEERRRRVADKSEEDWRLYNACITFDAFVVVANIEINV